jgi:hypothetical protein
MNKFLIIVFILISLLSPVKAFDDNVGEGNFYLEQIETSLKSISGVFDNFITLTPDPTGIATCTLEDGLFCYINKTSDSYFELPTKTALLPSTKLISDKLLLLTIPLGIIFICLESLELIINKQGQRGMDMVKRLCLLLGLLLLTPYLLSLSILSINFLSHALLDNNSLTSFISHFAEQLGNTPSQNVFEAFFRDILQALDPGGANPFSYISALPVMLPLGLIFILLLFISFQFIIRFLALYFLSALYPIVLLALLYERSAFVIKNYLKIWLTFLVQQPVFILGFVLVKDILYSIFDKGISFEALIIFVGMLIFLASINLFASRIWGDAYAVVAQNITAAVATNAIKSNLIDKPLQLGASLFNKQYTGKPLQDVLKSQQASKEQDKKGESGQAVKPKSLLFNDLSSRGYHVRDLNDGRLSVSGQFFTNKQQQGDITKLYTGIKDAALDGNEISKLEKVNLNALKIQDPSNIRAIRSYNSNLKNFAAENNGHLPQSGISYKSADNKIARNMNYAKQLNLGKGVQAIATNSDHIGGDKTIKSDNILKIHTYDFVLKNKNAD